MTRALRQRQPRVRDKKYLAAVALLPSVLSGKWPVEVCHIRYADETYGKRYTGLGEKPSDCWTLPLTAMEHRTGPEAQHSSGEREWWEKKGIDPLKLCAHLFAAWNNEPDKARAVAQMRAIILNRGGLR